MSRDQKSESILSFVSLFFWVNRGADLLNMRVGKGKGNE